jgi:hypothetical protein
MSKLTALKSVKKLLLPGVFAAGVAALIGLQSTGVAAQGSSQLWSIVVHFEYQDGFEYDYVIARGVPTDVMPSMLAECGASHWTGSVVRYHCFPVAE